VGIIYTHNISCRYSLWTKYTPKVLLIKVYYQILTNGHQIRKSV